jgi:hypothetical protein
MTVETLGDAWQLGWRITVRCALGKYCQGLKSKRECVYSAELDLQTLACTRGLHFALDQLSNRLKCPRCGSREVRVLNRISLRLGARIWDLRQQGWEFDTDERPDKNTVYRVTRQPTAKQLAFINAT